MNRIVSTVATLAALSSCVVVGTAAVSTIVSIDDAPGRIEQVAPVEVSPSPAAAAPESAPTPEADPGGVAPVAPTAPRDVSHESAREAQGSATPDREDRGKHRDRPSPAPSLSPVAPVDGTADEDEDDYYDGGHGGHDDHGGPRDGHGDDDDDGRRG